MTPRIALLLDISGALAILAGLWLLGPAFALIGAGAACLVASVLVERRGGA